MRRLIPCLLTATIAGGCADHDTSPPPPGALPLDVVYETRLALATEVSSASDVTLADLTGDGIPDLAAIDRAGAIRILVGQGGGVFAFGGSVPTTPDGSDIRAADLDRDGDLDLVVSSAARAAIAILLNDGGAGFVPMPELATAPLPTSFAVQDCDGDTVPDVLVSHLSPSPIAVFFGRGDGTFGPPAPLAMPAPGPTVGVAVAEVTGDAHADVLVADIDHDRVVAFVGSAAGPHDVALSIPVGDEPFGIAAGDLTGDGRNEVLVACLGDRTLRVYAYDGIGFVELQQLVLDGVPGAVAVADLSGDGAADAAVCMLDTRSVAILEGGSATAPLGRETRLGTTGYPRRPLPDDVDGDGRIDLLVAATGAPVLDLFLGRPVGLAGSRHWATPLANPSLVAAADLDGDGVEELLAAARLERRVAILRARPSDDGTGDPRLEPAHTLDFADGDDVRDLLAHDVDGDGRVDVVALLGEGAKVALNRTAQGGPLAFYTVPPTGRWFAATPAGDASLVRAGDVTGDGRVDLVVAYGSRLAVARGIGGTGGFFGFEPAETIDLSSEIGGLAVGDLDGDGGIEIAASLAHVAVVQVLEVSPGGALAPAFELPVGNLPTRLDTGDLDRDGRTDLVVSNGTSDDVTILVSGGGGGFRRIDVPVGDAPTALAVRDFNRDNIPDILVTSLLGGDFHVLLGDGSGGVLLGLEFPGTFTANTAALADLNGDGLADLTIGGFETRRLAVFRNVSRAE